MNAGLAVEMQMSVGSSLLGLTQTAALMGGEKGVRRRGIEKEMEELNEGMVAGREGEIGRDHAGEDLVECSGNWMKWMRK